MLFSGTRITMSDGSSAVVMSYIASGGQGEVYKVKVDGIDEPLALKWFTSKKLISNPDFEQTLSYNCRHGSPSSTFLWPIAMTERQLGSLGYIMPLMPEGYIGLGRFFCIDRYPDAFFRSWLAKINAALKITDAFSCLHKLGFSYQDINDGSFLIEPHTGDVLICDNDNIVVNGFNNGVAGTPRYMAPEVAEGYIPTTESDCLSLAIILYRIFVVDHPFEGSITVSGRYACLTPAEHNRLFGRDAVFCHDRTDASNRPVAGLHNNSLHLWPLLCDGLRDAFCRALSHKAICNPGERMSASDWEDLLVRVRANLMVCSASPDDPPHDFLAESELPEICPRCGEKLSEASNILVGGKPYRISAGKPIFIGKELEPAAICLSVKN